MGNVVDEVYAFWYNHIWSLPYMKKQVVEPIVAFLAIIIVPKVSYKFVKPQSVPIFMNMSYKAFILFGVWHNLHLSIHPHPEEGITFPT